MHVPRRTQGGEIWLAAGTSLILHLGVTLLPRRLPAPPPERLGQLEVRVVDVRTEPAATRPAPTRETLPPSTERPTQKRRRPADVGVVTPAPTPAPSEPSRTEPGRPVSRYATLRPVAGQERAPGPVPIGSFVPDGAPSRGQLPPGALGDGPVRAPPPPVPGKGDGPLGDLFDPAGDGGYKSSRPGFKMRVNRDGSVTLKDRGSFAPWAGRFDWSDALMRSLGQDPYLAEKRRMMEVTFDARSEMAREDRSDRLREAVVRMPRYLGKIWANPKWSTLEKRRLFFLLWDEVMEEGDEEMVATGRAIRASILGFIRRTLPEGSPDGYSAEELATLNGKRTSRASFAPY